MAMNKKRLLKLADFLETVPKKNFEMQSWGAKPATKPEGKRPGSCGFAGCAMGWAAHAKLFRGLKLKFNNYSEPSLVYKGLLHFNAASKCMEITHDQALYLFHPMRYGEMNNDPTPKQVAKRLREFVKSGGVIANKR